MSQPGDTTPPAYRFLEAVENVVHFYTPKTLSDELWIKRVIALLPQVAPMLMGNAMNENVDVNTVDLSEAKRELEIRNTELVDLLGSAASRLRSLATLVADLSEEFDFDGNSVNHPSDEDVDVVQARELAEKIEAVIGTATTHS